MRIKLFNLQEQKVKSDKPCCQYEAILVRKRAKIKQPQDKKKKSFCT